MKVRSCIFGVWMKKKQKDMGDVRRVFEEKFDVVHGDKDGG